MLRLRVWLQGNIRVFCRLRPKISEDGDGPQSEFAITQNKADDQIADVMSKGKKTSFDMDVVFPPTSTQQQVRDVWATLFGCRRFFVQHIITLTPGLYG